MHLKGVKQKRDQLLITYTVAGDNNKKNSLKILNSISQHADILEAWFSSQHTYC